MEQSLQIRVLVVDDEDTVRRVLQKLLTSSLGYKVDVVGSGREAVDAVTNDATQFGVVLLDVSTPGMQAEDVVEAIHRAAPDLPIVLMSGHDPEVIRSRFSSAGIAAFLSKPFELHELKDALRRVTDNARSA